MNINSYKTLNQVVFLHGCLICAVLLASKGSKVEENSPHHPKVKDSSPVTAAGTQRDKTVKIPYHNKEYIS
jgi:hypothetical protein